MDRLDELPSCRNHRDRQPGRCLAALRAVAPGSDASAQRLEDRIGMRLVERTTRRLAPTKPVTRLRRTGAAPSWRLRPGAGRRGLAGVGSRRTAHYCAGAVRPSPCGAHRVLIPQRVSGSAGRADPQRPQSRSHRGGTGPRRAHRRTRRLRAWVARQVGSVRRLVVASPAYLARRGMPLTPPDLAAHDTIFGMAGTLAGARVAFRTAPRGAIVRLSPRLLVDDVEAQIQAARAGRGIARPLSYQVRDELASGSLIRLLQDFEPEPLPVQLVTLSRGYLAPKVPNSWTRP